MNDDLSHISEAASGNIRQGDTDQKAKELALAAASATGGAETSADRLQAAAERYAVLRDSAATSDGATKEAKRKMSEILKRELPALLLEIGVPETVTPDARFRVAQKTQCMGSISAAPDTEVAVDYLASIGFAGSMGTTLTVEFGHDDRDKAIQLAEMISETMGLACKIDRSIHAATLKSFALERINDGLPVDLETIGLRAWREATVKEL